RIKNKVGFPQKIFDFSGAPSLSIDLRQMNCRKSTPNDRRGPEGPFVFYFTQIFFSASRTKSAFPKKSLIFQGPLRFQ
ncbi:MAG: hypothetical protein IJO51_07695, partial [Clostridia bacterium]|nr:hypothetical protein [Clostridia bacterium]